MKNLKLILLVFAFISIFSFKKLEASHRPAVYIRSSFSNCHYGCGHHYRYVKRVRCYGCHHCDCCHCRGCYYHAVRSHFFRYFIQY